MDKEKIMEWPSGDCKPVLATIRTTHDLAGIAGIATFREKDDLDWFEGAFLTINGLGPVLLMKHDNNPEGLTAFYVDVGHDSERAEMIIMQHFSFSESDVFWRRSVELKG